MKKVIGIFIGLLLFSGMLYGLFISFNVVQKTKETAKKYEEKINFVYLDFGDRKIFPQFEEISEFVPESMIRHSATRNGKSVFDFTYKVNKWGLRKEPTIFQNSSNHFFFSGCSIVFGMAVQDHETMSSMLARKLSNFHIVNLGQTGGGLHTQIRLMDYVNLKSMAKEENGIYFYLFFDDHFNRWTNAAQYVMWAKKEKISYQEKNGELVPLPLYKTTQYQKMQKAKEAGLEESYLRLNQPGEWKDNDIAFFISGVKLLKSKYLKIYPKGRFVFALFPMVATTPQLNKLVEQLKAEQIEVFDMRKNMADFVIKNKKKLSDFKVPLDGHPNPYFINIFTDFILKELKF